MSSSGPLDLDTVTLEPMVRALLKEPAAEVNGWSARSLDGGASEGMGLYHVSGSARVGGIPVQWALVCKMYASALGIDGGAWDYQHREPLAYGSGLLATLPPGAISAPRFLAVDPQANGSTLLWLEAIADAHPGPWSCDRFAQVARQLGCFNGAYLTGTPLPDQAWLSRQWLRDFIAPSGPALAELESLTSSATPLLRKLYPPLVVAELRRLWAERDRYFMALELLPQTFCHHDAFRRNFLHRAEGGGEELVAIDWAYAGLGAIGEDLGQLVVASLYFFEAEGIRPRDLAETCFTGYMAGLRDAGWAGDERDVRLGFTIAAALRHTIGLLRVICPLVADPVRRSVVEDRFGRPPEETVEAWADLWPLQFELADEARSLLLAAG